MGMSENGILLAVPLTYHIYEVKHHIISPPRTLTVSLLEKRKILYHKPIQSSE